MEQRQFGKTGMEVSVLGFGAAEIGFGRVDHSCVDTLIGVAQDVGVNVIDTAAMYGDSESKLGRALHGRRNRFFIFTKCGRNLPAKATKVGLWLRTRQKLRRLAGRTHVDEPLDWNPLALEWNIEHSLRRLGTDRLDLIQLHGCSEQTLRRGEAIDVLKRVQQRGEALHIGYSGDGAAAEYAIRCGAFDAVQISVNIADQQSLDGELPLARERELGVVAKRPLANGLWTAKQRPSLAHNQAYWERLQKLSYGFLDNRQAFATALRFTLSIQGVHTAVVGTANPEHLRQNAEAAEAGPLSSAELQNIRSEWNRVVQREWVAQT